MGGARLPTCPGRGEREGEGHRRRCSQWARRSRARGGAQSCSRQPVGARRAGKGGACAVAQPMGLARGGAGRGVGALAAARWPPRLFGPGGGSADQRCPHSGSPRLPSTLFPLRCPPRHHDGTGHLIRQGLPGRRHRRRHLQDGRGPDRAGQAAATGGSRLRTRGRRARCEGPGRGDSGPGRPRAPEAGGCAALSARRRLPGIARARVTWALSPAQKWGRGRGRACALGLAAQFGERMRMEQPRGTAPRGEGRDLGWVTRAVVSFVGLTFFSPFYFPFAVLSQNKLSFLRDC